MGQTEVKKDDSGIVSRCAEQNLYGVHLGRRHLPVGLSNLGSGERL